MPASWLTDPWLASLHKRNKLAPTWHHQCLKTHPLCSVHLQAAGWAVLNHLQVGIESPSSTGLQPLCNTSTNRPRPQSKSHLPDSSEAWAFMVCHSCASHPWKHPMR